MLVVLDRVRKVRDLRISSGGDANLVGVKSYNSHE